MPITDPITRRTTRGTESGRAVRVMHNMTYFFRALFFLVEADFRAAFFFLAGA